MHELSLVSSLLEMIVEDAQKRGFKKVTCVRLSVGEYSGANRQVLEFALEHLSRGTPLEGAAFDLAVEEASCLCNNCQLTFKPEQPFFTCPFCGRASSSFVKGKEVYIDYYEGE